MTQQEILKSNKTIADFMEVSYQEFHSSIVVCGEDESIFDYDPIAYLNYDSDWSILMQVVEKISQLGWQFELNSYKTSNTATFVNGVNATYNSGSPTPILATYNLVIDFINWHNQQNKKQSNKNTMTAEQIAQWVIDNRYPKSEQDKVSDFEMYHKLVEEINKLYASIENQPQNNLT